MTTPALENEAIRLGIIPPKPDPFAWMQETVYEPAPIQRTIIRRRRYVRIIFAALSVASIVGGILAALSH